MLLSASTHRRYTSYACFTSKPEWLRFCEGCENQTINKKCWNRDIEIVKKSWGRILGKTFENYETAICSVMCNKLLYIQIPFLNQCRYLTLHYTRQLNYWIVLGFLGAFVKITKRDFWLPPVSLFVCLSVRIYELGTHWTIFAKF